MTIAAAYLTSEGVVFGADSSTTVSVQSPTGKSEVAQLLNHAQKVFEIGEHSRLAACTWGAGSIGPFSHRTIIAQLAERIDLAKTSVREAADMLSSIVAPTFAKAEGNEFVGYYLGGWDVESHVPSCFQVEIHKNQPPKISALGNGNCSFSGAPQFFTRVFRGYDLRLPEMLFGELAKRLPASIEAEAFKKSFEEAFQHASLPLLALGYQDLPIREAIDFVYSYLHITVKALKFSFGAPLAGGPIEVGFVTSDRRFRWVRHKSFSSAILEEEADHELF